MNRPTIHELECFVAVAGELNFSRAAARLRLSQPPLSRQIQALEEKLGCRLLERSTRAVSLTAAGQLFLTDVQGIFNQLDGAAEVVRRIAKGENSRLRLGFVGALMDGELVQLLQRFRKRHPQCQLHLTDLTPGPQMQALLAGQLDGAFIGASPKGSPKRLEALIWKRERLLFAMPASHGMAGQASIRPAQLGAEGWVMVSREAAPAFRQQFDHWCETAGFKPRIVQESERVAAVLTMVAAGQGISLLPPGLSRLIGPGVAFIPVSGARPPVLEHTFLHPKKRASRELSDFVELLKECQRKRGGGPGSRMAKQEA
ncbi:MAG: LysR substrate-binding domain-containing protein [Chthoniobacteraceae bacterium]